MKRLFQLTLLTLAGLALCAHAQTVGELQTNYTGTTTWDSVGGLLTFSGSGEIALPKSNYEASIWVVPSVVKRIVIHSSVTVTGQFTFAANCTLAGQNRTTSKIYGTPEQRWADNRGVSPVDFSAVLSTASTVTVSNLTSLNPKGYHVRGGSGNKINMFDCDFYDTRGGSGNHSDGFTGGNGSLVRNCYFETGDDIIKVYWGTTYYDGLVIKMVQNAVPIQLGWGSYGSGAVGHFTNLTVLGNSGRGSDKCVVNGATGGAYTKTVNIYGCNIQNTNATLMSLYQVGQTLSLNIDDAFIKVKQFTNSSNLGTFTSDICGSPVRTNFYNCLPAPLLTVLPVPGEFRLQWDGPCGMTHRVLRSTNLVGWTQVLTTNSPALPFAWSDPSWPTRPAGFYRVEIIP
jgi:hypothetical protein